MSLKDLEFIGHISAQESSEALAPLGRIVDHHYIKSHAIAQEYGGFDKACWPSTARRQTRWCWQPMPPR